MSQENGDQQRIQGYNGTLEVSEDMVHIRYWDFHHISQPRTCNLGHTYILTVWTPTSVP